MDYIVVMNNDVMIKDTAFLKKLYAYNPGEKAEVVLPEIINKRGKKQNPYRLKPVGSSELNRMLLTKIVLLLLYYTPVLCNLWMKKRTQKKELNNQANDNIETYTEMLVPHGSCVIFSKKWIENENIAFIPDTFMYHEEDILYEYILNKGYKTVFCRELIVHHMEDVSTSSIANTELKKARFYLRHSIYPIIMLKKVRRYNEKKTSFIPKYNFIEQLLNSKIQ